MTGKEEIVNSLKKTLEELDITSHLRLTLIQTIEYLQEDAKFKIGQFIRQGDVVAKIVEVSEDGYHCDNAFVPFTAQDQWELVEESIDYNKLNTMLDDSLEKETPESWNEMLKEDTTHRTKTDVDAAMVDVEEKAKTFTEAHKGETADEILAGMRGEEPIIGILSRYLDHAFKEEAMEVKSAIDRWFSECFPEPVSEGLNDIALKYANEHLAKAGLTDKNCPREYAVAIGSVMFNAFKAGANWQKEQDKQLNNKEK